MMFDDLRDLYQETILERSRHPRHGKRPASFDATARGNNPMCGDRCQVFVRSADDGRIEEVGFEARGCAISLASADLMADAVAGKANRRWRQHRESAETGCIDMHSKRMVGIMSLGSVGCGLTEFVGCLDRVGGGHAGNLPAWVPSLGCS